MSNLLNMTFHRGKVTPQKKKRKKKKRKSKNVPRLEGFANELDIRAYALDTVLNIFERSMEQDEIEEKKFLKFLAKHLE